MRAGQVELAHVGETGFPADGLSLGRRPDIWEWQKRHGCPITDEQSGTKEHQHARLEKTEKQSGEEIRQGDALQHAQQADVGPRIGKTAVAKNAQSIKQDTPDENPLKGPGASGRGDGFTE